MVGCPLATFLCVDVELACRSLVVIALSCIWAVFSRHKTRSGLLMMSFPSRRGPLIQCCLGIF